jgi:uncharacterized protein YecE (DUF72 family)
MDVSSVFSLATTTCVAEVFPGAQPREYARILSQIPGGCVIDFRARRSQLDPRKEEAMTGKIPEGKVHAGTSGWAYASWKPRFYPATLSSAKFLSYYATRLNSVEVNYTFRNQVSKKLFAKWIAATPADFKFAVKAHQAITHVKRLRRAAPQTSKFLKSLEPFRDAGKLGPVLFQLPPNLKCDLVLLEDFLDTLRCPIRAAVEFRHASWFVDEVYERLGRANVAFCQAESDKLETPDVVTADFCYLRLRKAKYSSGARKLISHRVAESMHRGDVFAYFKHGDTPEGALYAERLLEGHFPIERSEKF